MTPQGIVIHHSLTKDGKTVDWEGIRKYHTSYRHYGEVVTKDRFVTLQAAGARGLESPWSDIGYHAGIERVNGVLTLMTGRDLSKYGAHCAGKNDHIGICLVGNFDLAPPDDATLSLAATLTAGYLKRFKLSADTVHRHHDFAAKSCPGKLFPWAKFMEKVRA